MASKIILACGIPIPNGSMEFKSDGFGQAYWTPDGYRISVLYGTDMISGQLKTFWTTTRRGDPGYPYAPIYASRARCLTASVKQSATVNLARYVDSPPSPPGYLWGAEANDPLGTGADFWWVRLRFWWRGFGIAPGSLGQWAVQLIGYSDAAESSPSLLCAVNLNGVSDWGTGWVQKASAPFQITSNVHHVRVRFVQDRGATVAGFYASGSVTDYSVETLGPVDAVFAPPGPEITNPTYAAEGVGGTYYQMTKDRLWDGFDNAPSRPGKGSRLPSGSWRWFDSTGGTKKRRWSIPLRMLSRADADKLERLHLVNKGQSSETASLYGTAFPLVFSPQQPDQMGFFYVAMEDEKLPIQQDGYFQSNTEAGHLYRCQLNLVEI